MKEPDETIDEAEHKPWTPVTFCSRSGHRRRWRLEGRVLSLGKKCKWLIRDGLCGTAHSLPGQTINTEHLSNENVKSRPFFHRNAKTVSINKL